MAAINFPSSPSNGDTHVVDGVTYTYNSAETKWKTTINSNAFLPLSGGTVSGTLTVNDDLAVDTNTLFVDVSTDRVGIGTTSPSKKLHVNGGQVLFQETAAASNAVLRLKGSSTSHGGALIAQSSSDGTAPLQFWSGSTQTAEIDSSSNLKFNSGYGSVATAYGVRAWVSFNGTGTVSIRSSGNISSITDNGTGDYTLNFTNAMPDINYSVVGHCGYPAQYVGLFHCPKDATPRNTANVRIATFTAATALLDFPYVDVLITR